MRSVAALLVAATLAGLTGCGAPADAQPAASPSTSATPVFASEEEALAAAEKAYTEYLRIYDAVLNDGGEGADSLESVATQGALEEARDSARLFRVEGLQSDGATRIVDVQFQHQDPNGVGFYVCEDVGAIDLLDSNGDSIVSKDRPPRTAFEVRAVAEGETLKIAVRTLWAGAGVCS